MEIRNKMRESQSTILDPAILLPAIGQSFIKLNPRLMIKNPVMFVVEIVALLTTIIFLRDMKTSPRQWLKAVARRRRRPCARRAPRPPPSGWRR